MKTLILTRHAKSSWDHLGLSDFDRPLNERGKRDAPFMGRLMVKKKRVPDLIISSPAKRAIKTARILAKAFEHPKEKILIESGIYDSNSEKLLEIIQATDNTINKLMLVGHNPDLTWLAYSLSRHPVNNIPTCGIFGIQFDVENWQMVDQGKGQFLFFEYPKKYQD